jgi:hypothetical protein
MFCVSHIQKDIVDKSLETKVDCCLVVMRIILMNIKFPSMGWKYNLILLYLLWWLHNCVAIQNH